MRPEVSPRGEPSARVQLALRIAVIGAALLLVLPWETVLLAAIGVLGLCTAPAVRTGAPRRARHLQPRR